MRGVWSNENVTHTRTWHKFKLQWQTTFEFSVTAWNIYGESKLDQDNSCIVTIGKGWFFFSHAVPSLDTFTPLGVMFLHA